MSGSARIFDRVRAATPTLSVGVLSADVMALGDDVAALEKNGITLLHFDVMDGCFCPMLTVGAPFVKAVRTNLIKDVHLMVDEPLDKLAEFVAAGADILTVHVEASRHPHRLLQAMRDLARRDAGLVRGIAINPGTPVRSIEPLLAEVEMITLLAINPGWGGQAFLPSTAARVAELLAMIRASGRDILTTIDGGVTKTNVADVARLGADVIVTGSAIFEGRMIESNIAHMRAAIAGSVQ